MLARPQGRGRSRECALGLFCPPFCFLCPLPLLPAPPPSSGWKLRGKKNPGGAAPAALTLSLPSAAPVRPPGPQCPERRLSYPVSNHPTDAWWLLPPWTPPLPESLLGRAGARKLPAGWPSQSTNPCSLSVSRLLVPALAHQPQDRQGPRVLPAPGRLCPWCQEWGSRPLSPSAAGGVAGRVRVGARTLCPGSHVFAFTPSAA